MEIVGLRKLPIARFRFPGDFQKKLDSPDAAQLAKSFEEIGELHNPVVRECENGDYYEVIAGETRMAAHMLLKRKLAICKLVRCTDEEVKRIRLAENVHRRHDPAWRDVAMNELVELMAKTIVKEEGVRHGPRHAGRPRSDKGLARQHIAEERGISEGSVRTQEWRANRRQEAEMLGLSIAEYEVLRKRGELPVTRVMEPPALPPIRTMGMELDTDFAISMVELQKYLDEAAGKVRLASSALVGAEKLGLPLRAEEMTRAKEMLRVVGALIHNQRPWSICGACKGIERIQKECITCRQKGYVTKEEEGRVPVELLNVDEPMVLHRGKMYPMALFGDEATAQVVDPFGGLPE